MDAEFDRWWNTRDSKMRAIAEGIGRFIERPQNAHFLNRVLALPPQLYSCRCAQCPHSADEIEAGICTCYGQCECQTFHSFACYLSDEIYEAMDAKHWLEPDDVISIFYCAFCDLAEFYQAAY